MSVWVRAQAAHQSGLLTRLAAVLNPYDVEGFDYRLGPAPGQATLDVRVGDDPWEVNRVAARLGRVIGVSEVSVEPVRHPVGGWAQDRPLEAASSGSDR